MIGETHDSLQETEDLVAQYGLLGGKINRFLRFVESNWRVGEQQ
jgi:hypothetical protein